MKAVIECGANKGGNTQELRAKYPHLPIFALEPTRELLQRYLYPIFDRDKQTYILPFAVDIENTFKEFKIAGWDNKGSADWGCSSLYDFSDDIHSKWPGRPDFAVSHVYQVPTITLKDLCNIYNITEIEYLWVDTQGNDFNVLLSLGDMISKVNEGRVEVADRVELYKNTNNTLPQVKEWLEKNNFSVNIQSNGFEADILFKKIL
jgi:FkbM family methyltransferase